MFMMSLPNGTRVDIATVEGTNAYLNAVDNFELFSSTFKEIRKLQKKKNLNHRKEKKLETLLSSMGHITENADPKTFAKKIPPSEIQEWLNYTTEEIKSLTKKQNWIQCGELKGCEVHFLELCAQMFRHALPIRMAFKSDFFQDLTCFTAAGGRTEFHINHYLICSVVGRIATKTLAIAPPSFGWSLEKIFNKFETSGFLEEILVYSALPKLPEVPEDLRVDQDLLSDVLGELESCPGFLTRKFKVGEPCGDALKRFMDDRDTSTYIPPKVRNRLTGITTLVETMDTTDFEANLVYGQCSNCGGGYHEEGAKLRACARCDFAFYCSKECQEESWQGHKPNCQKLSSAELDRAYSLRMNLVRFMKKNNDAVVEAMEDFCDKSGYNWSDLAVEINLMPDKNGNIPALQDPPDFDVNIIEDYKDGLEFPNFFDSDWDTELQETWLRNLAAKMMSELEYKRDSGTFVVYHAGRIYVDTKSLRQCTEFLEAGLGLDDIPDMRLGTDWCSPPVSLDQKIEL